MTVLLLTIALAQAEPAAHHHPDSVARASASFEQAQQASTDPFERVRLRSRALAAGLEAWRLGLDLLGERAADAEHEALVAARRAFFRDQAIVSAFANDMMTAFDTAFSEALDRALAAEGGSDWPVCRSEAPSRLRMGPGPRAESQDCPGEDRSAALAARMDADPVLAATLDEITGRTWPAFSDVSSPASSPEGTYALDIVAWFRQHAGDALAAIDQAEEDARLPVDAALEQDPSPEQTDALRIQVDGIVQNTASARASLAAPVLATVDAVAPRLYRKGVPEPSWCPRPRVYGGCDAPAMAPDAEQTLMTHPKVRRALDQAGR